VTKERENKMNIGTMNIDNLMESITEEEAMRMVYAMSQKFEWVMWFQTKEDVMSALQTTKPTPISDEQIESVMSTRMWRKVMQEALADTAWECMQDAIYEAENGEI
jgi:hypothetical protein